MIQRFMLVQDDDCHWYMIPADKQVEWNEFRNIPSDDERSWDVPLWAEQIDSYRDVTFENPIIR